MAGPVLREGRFWLPVSRTLLLLTLAVLVFPLSFAFGLDKVRAGGKVWEGEILERSDAERIYMELKGGIGVSWPREEVEILEWPGVGDAAESLEAAREHIADGDAELAEGNGVFARRAYREAAEELQGIRRPALERFVEAQRLLRECRRKERQAALLSGTLRTGDPFGGGLRLLQRGRLQLELGRNAAAFESLNEAKRVLDEVAPGDRGAATAYLADVQDLLHTPGALRGAVEWAEQLDNAQLGRLDPEGRRRTLAAAAVADELLAEAEQQGYISSEQHAELSEKLNGVGPRLAELAEPPTAPRMPRPEAPVPPSPAGSPGELARPSGEGPVAPGPDRYEVPPVPAGTVETPRPLPPRPQQEPGRAVRTLAEAESQRRRGSDLLAAGRYGEAVEAYERSEAEMPEPGASMNGSLRRRYEMLRATVAAEKRQAETALARAEAQRRRAQAAAPPVGAPAAPARTAARRGFIPFLPAWASGLVVGGAVLVLCGVLGLVLTASHRTGPRYMATVEEGDACRQEAPGKAMKQYRKAIEGLEKLEARRPLQGEERKAMGRALLGQCQLLLARKERDRAMQSYRRAAQYMPVSARAITGPMAAAYAEDADLSDEAVSFYLSYLRLPVGDVDPASADKVVALLEQHCRIDPQMDGEERQALMRLNRAVACIPGPGVRLVVTRGQGVGTQYVMDDMLTIGRGADSDIVVSEGGLGARQATVMRDGDDYKLRDPRNADGVRSLEDGEEISFGSTVVTFYCRPRPLGRELDWPHLNLGLGYMAERLYDRALGEVKQVTRLNPENAHAHWAMGQIGEVRGEREEAIAAYRRALELREDHHAAHHALGKALLAGGGAAAEGAARRDELAEAIDHLRAAAHAAPRRPDYWADLARACRAAGRAQEAVEAARAGVEADEGSVDCHALLAELGRETADADLAQEGARAALELDPMHSMANYVRGNVAFEQGDFAAAAEHLERVRRGETQRGVQELSGDLEFSYRLGRSLYEQGEYVRASRVLAPVAKASRDAMFYVARCHTHAGRYESAARILRALLRQYGEDAEARYYLAATFGNMQAYKAALHEADRLVGDEEWGVRAECLAGRVLALGGRFDEAEERLKRAAALAPDSGEVHFERGRLACARGEFDRAVEEMDMALRTAPERSRWQLWLGRALYGQGRCDEAEEQFKSVLTSGAAGAPVGERESLLADAHYHAGRIARDEGRGDEALVHFQAAREHGADDESLAFEMAVAYAECGRDEQALAEFSSLAVEHGDDPVIAYDLAAVSARLGAAHLEQERHAQAIPLLEQAAEGFEQVGADEQRKAASRALAETCFRAAATRLLQPSGTQASSTGYSAGELMDRACSIAPGDPVYRYYLGVARFREGDYDRAVTTFREVVQQGAGDGRADRGLALALERSGDTAGAVDVWRRMAEHHASEPLRRVEGQLGLAGVYSRQQDWRKTADILHEVLDQEVARQHDAYSEMCKLAASYFSLAGDHVEAENVIRDHLSGSSPGDADAYLGAVLAQQGRLEESLPFLRRAVRNGDNQSAVADLFEHASRTLAAHKVFDGEIETARHLLGAIATVKTPLDPDTNAFLTAVEAAAALRGTGAEITPETIEVYEKAHEQQPDNPRILRNLAVLCHMRAIQLEEAGSFADSLPYWHRASRLWRSILESRDGFWDAYRESYNEGKHRRGRIGEEDLDAVRSRVRKRVAGVHVAFACAYAASGNTARIRTHVQSAREFYPPGEPIPELAAALLAEAQKRKQAGGEEEFFSLAQMAYEVDPENRDVRSAYAAAVFNKGSARLEADDLDGAARFYEQARQIDPNLMDNPTARRQLAVYYVKKAANQFRAGNRFGAEATYSEATSRIPDLETGPELRKVAAQYYVVKGDVEMGRSDFANARESFERALELDPTVLVTVQGLREACQMLGVDTSLGDLFGMLMGNR
ncbi:MAG: tetratricopeptide repeat protein [Candidatus Brocadiia bacterium]